MRTFVNSTDQVEGELTRMIERRHDQRVKSDGERREEESYMESVRVYREKERREHLWQRLRFHERQIANHTATFMEILERHKAGRLRCEEMLGIQTERKETA